MATTTRNVNIAKFGYINERYPSTHYSLVGTTWYELSTTIFEHSMLVGLDAWPSSLKHNKLVGLQFYLNVNAPSNLQFYSNDSDFDASAVTYYTAPSRSAWIYQCMYSSSVSGDTYLPSSLNGTKYDALTAQEVLAAPSITLYERAGTSYVKTLLSDESTTPYAIVSYDDTDLVASEVTYKSGPKDGYANPNNAQTFAWQYVKASDSEYCADETWEQTSATFYWKSSSDANYTSVAISGSATSTTIAASTFPSAETISWYVTGTDEDGTTSTSSVYTFSTTAGDVDTVCLDPVNQVIDGSADYDFSWTITSTDGQAASRTVLQYSTDDGVTWTDIVDDASQLTSYTVPGGTFPAGSIQWQVLAYNIDGTLGTYTPATFISVAAPAAVQGLSATAVPYSTITWQSSEQQAYQISVDGDVVAKAYGADVYTYTLTEPLSDGDHTISVIVQGQYGYWSDVSSVTVTIANSAGDAVTLTGTFGIDANLGWSTSAATQDFYVYRDSVCIGHTENLVFTDRYALGNHSYYVLNKLSDGNYTKSNVLNGTLEASGVFISLLDGSGWMDITQSENSASEQTFRFERKYSLRHVFGAVYPVLELAPYEDFSGSYDCAFSDYALAKKFEAFQGQEVIIKSRGDKIVFGAITSMSSHYGDFVIGYTFSVQRIHVEDYIDDTDT